MSDHRKDAASATHLLGLPSGNRIVYVRRVSAEEVDLPEGLAALKPTIYAVHDEAGNRLALFGDRDLAFSVSRQNDMSPVSVH